MLTKSMKIVIISIVLASCGTADQLEEGQSSETDTNADFTQLLNEFGLTDDGESIEDQEENNTSLSDDATAILETIKLIRQSIRERLDLICSPNQDLLDTVRFELQEIYKDDSLSEEDKRKAAMAVREQYIEALRSDRAAMQQCIAENQEQWVAAKSAFEPIKEACLLDRKLWNHHHRRPERAADGGKTEERDDGKASLSLHHHREVNSDLLAVFNAKLTSEACRSAIATFTAIDGEDAAE